MVALEVVHLQGHLRVVARRSAGRLEQDELAAGAPVAQAARPLLDRLQAELFGVEAPCPLEVLGGKPRRHGDPLERG
jgi:hypothetical protein